MIIILIIIIIIIIIIIYSSWFTCKSFHKSARRATSSDSFNKVYDLTCKRHSTSTTIAKPARDQIMILSSLSEGELKE